MKRSKPTLRARTLDTKALHKVAGGRGSQCGAGWHCDECGASLCPIGMEGYYMSFYGNGCFNCGAAIG